MAPEATGSEASNASARRGCRMPTRQVSRRGAARGRRGRPRDSRARSTPFSFSISAARSTAYSLPKPPKSSCMPSIGKRTEASESSTNSQSTSASSGASSASAGTWPDSKRHARRSTPEVASNAPALPEAGIGEGEKPARLLVDANRGAAGLRIDARDDAVVAVARVLRLDAQHFLDGARGRGLGDGCVVRVELHLVLRGHGAEREAVQRHAPQKARLTPMIP